MNDTKRWMVGICAVLVAWTAPSMMEVNAQENSEEAAEELQVPPSLTHQGRLVDDEGTPMTGEIELTYTIYDGASAGDILWQDILIVDVDETGFYSVKIGGPDNPIDSAVLYRGEGWMGVSINGADELTPRIALNSVPYAVIAERARLAELAEYAAEADWAHEADWAAEANHAVEADLAMGVAPGIIDANSLADDFALDDELVTNITGQTLGRLSCLDGEVARFDDGQWRCDTTIDSAVTDVTAEGPLTSTGGDQPNITIPQADADTDGYMSAESFASFDNRMTTIETETGSFESRISTVENDTSLLEGQMTTVQGDITTLDGRMTSAEGNISSLDDGLTSLDGRMTSAESNISSLGDGLTSLDGRMTSAEGNISSLDDDLTLLDDRVTSAEGNISSLDDSVAIADDRIADTEDDITALDGRVGTVEDDTTTLDNRVTTLESEEFPVFSNFPAASGSTTNNFAPGERFVYDDIWLNNGGYYDPSTGIFTAPVTGIYEMCAGTRTDLQEWTMLNTFVGDEFIYGGASGRWLQAHDGNSRQQTGCISFPAETGDEISNYVSTSHGEARCGLAYCFFNVKLVAATE